MDRTNGSHPLDLGAHFFVLLLCAGAGFLFELLTSWFRGGAVVFFILTAGFYFYMGGTLLLQGVFLRKFWRVGMILFAPLVFLIEYRGLSQIPWYNGAPFFAYYLLFIAGYYTKTIPIMPKYTKRWFGD